MSQMLIMYRRLPFDLAPPHEPKRELNLETLQTLSGPPHADVLTSHLREGAAQKRPDIRAIKANVSIMQASCAKEPPLFQRPLTRRSVNQYSCRKSEQEELQGGRSGPT